MPENRHPGAIHFACEKGDGRASRWNTLRALRGSALVRWAGFVGSLRGPTVDWAMQIENVLASVAVKDLAAARRWYEDVLERPADSTPMPEVAEWKFPRGGWLQVYQLPERAGNCSCTLVVNDLAAITARLQELGLDTGEMIKSAQTKVIMIKDPDGNSLAFAQPLDSSMAR